MKRSVFVVKLVAVGLLFALVCVPVFSQNHPQSTLPPVTIPGTEKRTVSSSILGEDFDLLVNLPRGYQDTTKSFPVVYLLDAQWDFPLVNAVYGEQYYDGFVPAVIVVGITWGGADRDYDYLRARDLTPTKISQMPQSGNAPKFLDFIAKELFPYVNAHYRTVKNDRTLVGSSLGGLFTLHALFHDPQVFTRFILTSPSITWDNYALAKQESTYAKTHSDLPAKVFMGVGGFEAGTVGEVQKFADVLRGRGYKGLQLETRVLEGIGHSGSKAEGYTRGLQSVFARSPVSVAPDVLDRYVGVYSPAPNVNVEIVRGAGGLELRTPDHQVIPLLAESETDFYVKGFYLFLRFVRDSSGKVTGCEVEQFAGKQFIPKGK